MLLLLGLAFWAFRQDARAPSGRNAVDLEGGPVRVTDSPGTPDPAGDSDPEPVEAVPEAEGGVLVQDPAGRVLEGAFVTIQPPRGGFVDEPEPVSVDVGMTDDSGRVSWPKVEIPFPAIVRAGHPDFAPGEALAASRGEAVTVQLRRGIAIEGLVVDTAGRPVPRAAVGAELYPAAHLFGGGIGTVGSWLRSGTADEEGRFRIDRLPPGFTGLLTASAGGFLESRVPWNLLEGTSVRITLSRSFRAAVRVRDAAGRPLEDVAVWAFAGARHRLGRMMPVEPDVLRLPSAGEGLYAREDLPAGWYTVLAARAGYRMAVVESVAIDPERGPVEIVLEPTAGIGGRVISGDSKEPVPGVRVRAVPLKPVPPSGSREAERAWEWPVMEMEGPFTAVTGEDGRYVLPCLGPADRFTLQARGEDGETGFGNHPPHGKTEAPEVHDIWLHRTRRDVDYKGRVVSRDGGAPVAGAVVRGAVDAVTTDAEGRFHLVSRQQGSIVTVSAAGFLSPRTIFAPGTTFQGGGDGRQDFGDIDMVPLRRVPGVVVDGTGTPVPGLGVWALPEGRLDLPRGADFSIGFVSDGEGRLELMLVPGNSFRVRPVDNERLGETRVSGDSGEEFRLVVGPDPRGARGVLRGRLVLEDGSWEPRRVAVSLVGEGGASSGGILAEAAPDGSFEMPRVPAGSWTIRVSRSETLEGELTGIVVVPQGTVEVVLVCRRTGEEEGEPAELRIRVDPPPENQAALFARATRQPRGTSIALRPSGDGTYAGEITAGGSCAVLVFDAAARRAGIVPDLDPASGNVATVAMVSAGEVVPPPWEFGNPPWWIEVRTSSGTLVYSGLGTALPTSPDRGYVLYLPPGTYDVEVSVGEERKNPRPFRATVVEGGSVRLK